MKDTAHILHLQCNKKCCPTFAIRHVPPPPPPPPRSVPWKMQTVWSRRTICTNPSCMLPLHVRLNLLSPNFKCATSFLCVHTELKVPTAAATHLIDTLRKLHSNMKLVPGTCTYMYSYMYNKRFMFKLVLSICHCTLADVCWAGSTFLLLALLFNCPFSIARECCSVEYLCW